MRHAQRCEEIFALESVLAGNESTRLIDSWRRLVKENVASRFNSRGWR
jgi:hypothetical protein